MTLAIADIDAWITHGSRATSSSPPFTVSCCVTTISGFRKIYNESGLTTQTGCRCLAVSAQWVHKRDRVYGPDLMLALCEHSVKKAIRISSMEAPPACRRVFRMFWNGGSLGFRLEERTPRHFTVCHRKRIWKSFG